MNMLKILLFCLAPSIIMGSSEPQISEQSSTAQALVAQDLPLYKETEHFVFFCEPVDNHVTEIISKQCDLYFEQLCVEFDHVYNGKIIFNVYHDFVALCEAVGLMDGINSNYCWEMGSSNHICHIVAPKNFDTPDFACLFRLQLSFLGFVHAFVDNKYKNFIPGWLTFGVDMYKSWALYPAGMLLQNVNQLPTLKQLADYERLLFGEKNGHLCAFSLVKFLDKKWGWKTIKKLLADYTSFESILGITEEQFREQWIEYLIQEYGEENKMVTV